MRHAKTVIMVQDAEIREQSIALAYTSASALLDKQPPLFIDECQEATMLRDTVRSEVDKRDCIGTGLWLLLATD